MNTIKDNALPDYILKRAQYWATSDVFDLKTRDEVSALIKENAHQELNDRFYKELEFGTAGLRGILGAGSCRMNIYNIRKASHAVALYLREFYPDEPLKVALSYDCRQFSDVFAKASAEVFGAHSIKTLLTTSLGPVPLLSHLVRDQKCHGGVYITASHNPPNYNGYKVYMNTGGQIIPPHDSAITNYFNEIEKFETIPILEFSKLESEHLLEWVTEENLENYLKKVEGLFCEPTSRKIPVVYTALHGTGGTVLPQAFKKFGFDLVELEDSQQAPDGSFPTVKSPNPGEPDSFKNAIETATKKGAELIFGTDPDCDRLGMFVKSDAGFTYLNGNQMLCLLTHYLLERHHAHKTLPKNPLVVKTIVTSDLFSDIAKAHQVECEETLTGFKWIAEKIENYHLKNQKTYICGGEEAFGFLAGSFVRDKDGISAGLIAAEMAAYYKSVGKSLWDVLDELYLEHGFYEDCLYTLKFEGQEGAEIIKKAMETLRNYPTEIAGQEIASVNDILKQKSFVLANNSWTEAARIDLPISNVLQFTMKNGSKINARPSGTEPLIKFYLSIKDTSPKSKQDLIKAHTSAKAQGEKYYKSLLSYVGLNK